MTLPTSPVDKNWPKGPNFLGIVIGSAVAILLILGVALLVLRNRAQKMVPVKTESTPSQSMLMHQRSPRPAMVLAIRPAQSA